VLRDGKQSTLTAVCRIESSAADTGSDRPAAETASSDFDKLGMRVGPLTDEVAKQLGMPGVKGVVITSVDQGGPAARAGLTGGMVITEVRRTAVHSVKELETAIAKESTSAGVLLLVRTGAGSRFVVVKP